MPYFLKKNNCAKKLEFGKLKRRNLPFTHCSLFLHKSQAHMYVVQLFLIFCLFFSLSLFATPVKILSVEHAVTFFTNFAKNNLLNFTCSHLFSQWPVNYGQLVGRRSIVDKASAYDAKGPRFTTRWSLWRQQFINL